MSKLSDRLRSEPNAMVTKLRDYEIGYRPHVIGSVLADAADEVERQDTALMAALTALSIITAMGDSHSRQIARKAIDAIGKSDEPSTPQPKQPT